MSNARSLLRFLANGFAAVLIAAAIFLFLANAGVISRPVSETVTFGG